MLSLTLCPLPSLLPITISLHQDFVLDLYISSCYRICMGNRYLYEKPVLKGKLILKPWCFRTCFCLIVFSVKDGQCYCSTMQKNHCQTSFTVLVSSTHHVPSYRRQKYCTTNNSTLVHKTIPIHISSFRNVIYLSDVYLAELNYLTII